MVRWIHHRSRFECCHPGTARTRFLLSIKLVNQQQEERYHDQNHTGFNGITTFAWAAIATSPAQAASKAAVELVKCEANYGTIAVVDGDTQGWSKFGLGSPRELVAAIARESGCFSLHSAASGEPANFLINVIAGDKDEVDQGVSAAKGFASTALVHSGAAGQVLGRVPGAGALMGMFGGLGGKKKTVAAGIRVVSPANGQTLASGTGEVKNRACHSAAGTLTG